MATEHLKPVILVVDDDVALHEMVEEILKRANMTYLKATTARQAYDLLRRERPQVMVLDLMLPEMNGIDFLKQVRLQAQYDEMPVIILSALAEPEQIREGLNAGADRYVTKPYLAKNLANTIRDVLQKGRRQVD